MLCFIMEDFRARVVWGQHCSACSHAQGGRGPHASRICSLEDPDL